MQKSLVLDDYVEFMNLMATSKVVEVIKDYFNRDINRFYAAPGKWKRWKTLKDQHKLPLDEQTSSYVDSVFKDIRRCNFAGIEKKYVKSIMGHNYYVAGFMKKVKSKLETEYGYRIIPRGTLPYKGENHPYCTKYLPPKEKIEKIFESDEMVDIVTNASSYCNKVKKVIQAMQKDYAEKGGQDVSSWGKDKQKCNFTSPENLIGKLWAFLEKKGDAGTPMSFYNVLKPIATDYLYDQLKKHWFEKMPIDVQNKYVGDLEENMTAAELKTVFQKQLQFIKKIQKQLNGQFASKMFKDELIGKNKDGDNVFKPADEKRIEQAREAVEKKIESLNQKLAGLKRAN